MLKIQKHFYALGAICFFVCALAGIACTPRADNANVECDANTYFNMKIADVKFKAQLALTQSERALGLMNRDTLPDSCAMIFVFDTPQKMSFWMKNVNFDLDIGFVAPDGTLLEVKPMFAYRLDAVESASDNVLYCIETPSGWFAKNSISSGSKLNLNLLNNAKKARLK